MRVRRKSSVYSAYYKVSKQVSSAILKAIRDEVKSLNKGLSKGTYDPEHVQHHIQGMSFLARKLGVDCNCSYRLKKQNGGEAYCNCYTAYGKKRRKMTLSK